MSKYYEETLELLINKTLTYGYANGLKTFVNRSNEMIICPNINAFFRLEDVKTPLDFKCKIINWIVYYCAENHWYRHWSKKIMEYINYILGVNWTREDCTDIYGMLGNAIRQDLTIKFIESGYDMSLVRN